MSPKCENGYKNNKFQWVEILIKCIKHMEAKNSHNEVYIRIWNSRCDGWWKGLCEDIRCH